MAGKTNVPAHAICLLSTAAFILGLPLPSTVLQAQSDIADSVWGLRARVEQVRVSPMAPAATTVTITRSDDPQSDSITRTCGYTSGIYRAASDGCTLRRALVEAGARPAEDRPINIEFNLASDDPGYDAATDTWMIEIDDPLRLKPESITQKDGRAFIDGATQPGGRSSGPTVYIDTNDNRLDIELESNVIANLGFIGGGVIFLKEDSNLVTGISMGLSVDGQEIVLREPANPQRLAGGGVHISSNNNELTASVISGAFASAVIIDGGDNNLVQFNFIGTRADGSVPDVLEAIRCLRSFNYDANNWYGGWGINLSGSNNVITNNSIAGLHILQGANDTPPRAIEIFGSGHLIEENFIGMDFLGNRVGVCGQAIKVAGSDTIIADNLIYGSGLDSEDAEPAAILSSDTSPLFGQITVRGNLVEASPGKVYGFGPGISDSLRFFEPAAVTSVTSTAISGSSGPDSPCPNCLIDVFLDDLDLVQETLVYAGSVSADGAGNWTLPLSQMVPANAAVRTASTATSSGIIGTFGAGTTSKLSNLYVTPSSVVVDGPTEGDIGVQYQFDLTTEPRTEDDIYTYTITVTDFDAPLSGTFGSLANARLIWGTAGVKTIDVRVETPLGAVTTTHTITLSDDDPDSTPTPNPSPTPDPSPTPVPGSDGELYLPLVSKPAPAFPALGNGAFDIANDPVWVANPSEEVLIYSEDDVAKEADRPGFSAHSSPNVAWLGGKFHDQSSLWQSVGLPAEHPGVHLSFWHVIGSNERICGDDLGYVEVDNATLKTINLCRDTNTDGWQRVEVSLADYVGTTVDVTFRSTQDGQEISNWFLDDVILCDGTSAHPCE